MSIPGSAEPLLLAQQDTGGYQIQRSLRFNSSDSAYLSRTPASAGNRKTWTWAGWVKKGVANGYLFDAFNPASGENYIRFGDGTSDNLAVWSDVTGTGIKTSQVFRDYSAWYHILVAWDTTQATASNRTRLYVNGVEVTQFASATYPTQNADGGVNNNTAHSIGRYQYGASRYFDGYLADVYFIDGQALTPSSFTETSATTGQLIPKAYSGSFGTNGFWLKFSDNSAATATTLGKDYSGNSNNWTPNNLSVTAGAGNDSLVDTPTSGSQVDTGLGGQVTGNYCTLNPLDATSSNLTLANGNLDLTRSASSDGRSINGSISAYSGKWYYEVTIGSFTGSLFIGFANAGFSAASGYYTSGTKYMYENNGQKVAAGSQTSYAASWTSGDVIGVALDLDGGSITFYKNGVSQGVAATGINASLGWKPSLSSYNPSSASITSPCSFNFGQRQWAYAAPSGFRPLVDTLLPAPVVAKPSTVMDVVLRTGTGTSGGTISSLNFSADFIWSKLRSTSSSHYLLDSVRGIANTLQSNSTASEASYSTWFTSITSTGYTVGSGDWTSGASVVEWCWDAGTSTVTNTQGSITTSLRASPSSGFSVATWSGTGSGSVTVGHGLGVAPRFMIIKDRSLSRNWLVYHTSLGASSGLALNSTTAASGTDGGWWNHTAPTSTVATIGTYGNEASNYVGYFWAPVTGYSSMGSFVGNGSNDGPFIYTGHSVRWLLLKNATTAADWYLFDSLRAADYNPRDKPLFPNGSYAEQGDSRPVDLLSNGFKIRFGTYNWFNGNGDTIIYCAFAQNPFQYARAR